MLEQMCLLSLSLSRTVASFLVPLLPKAAQEGGGLGWLVIFVVVLILLIVMVWWIKRDSEEEPEPSAQAATTTVPGTPTEKVEMSPFPTSPEEEQPPVKTETPPEAGRDESARSIAVEDLPPAEKELPDNLTRIEGIGPKISGLLQSAGITTYEQLAATGASRLEQILREAQLRAPTDPTTWSEQARLAATGDWAALEKLQDQLKGGRRIT